MKPVKSQTVLLPNPLITLPQLPQPGLLLALPYIRNGFCVFVTCCVYPVTVIVPPVKSQIVLLPNPLITLPQLPHLGLLLALPYIRNWLSIFLTSNGGGLRRIG